jgi:hypothetical protein
MILLTHRKFAIAAAVSLALGIWDHVKGPPYYFHDPHGWPYDAASATDDESRGDHGPQERSHDRWRITKIRWRQCTDNSIGSGNRMCGPWRYNDHAPWPWEDR